jgi:hypothetical protein
VSGSAGERGVDGSGFTIAERKRASKVARLVAAVVFVLAAFLLLALAAGPDSGVDTTHKVEKVQPGPGAAPSQITTTTETKSPAPDRSLLARAFEGGSASVLFRLLLAAAAAFLAAAAVQRVLLGEYAVTIGPFSTQPLPPVTIEQAKEAVDLVSESPQLSSLLAPGGPRRIHPWPQYRDIEDERMSLISIRLELEERLKALAGAAGIDREVPVARLPSRLAQDGIIDDQAREGIEKLIAVGDRIAAGAAVDEAAAAELSEQAGDLLYALAELRQRTVERKEEDAGGP